MEKPKNIKVMTTPGMIQPIFSDMVQITARISETKDKKVRVGLIRLTFLDTFRRQILSEIVLDEIQAKELLKTLQESISKMDIALKSKEDLKKLLPPPTSTKVDTDYID